MTYQNYSKYLDPYIDSIMNNKVEHCEEQELMITNLLIPVLERDDVKVDDDKIEKALSLMKYFDFELVEWEIFLTAVVVGIVWIEDESPYFRDIRIYVGRGSGKNGLASFWIFYFISPYHGVKGYNIEIMANSEEQAKMSFMDVFNVIREPKPEHEKAIKAHYHATLEVITCKTTQSTIKYNTSSNRGKDSKRTGCNLFDEKHEYTIKDKKNIDTLSSGLGKVRNWRNITISTCGHERDGVLDKEQEAGQGIISKYDPDNRIFIFWCRIRNKEEWKDPNSWVKAIPSLRHWQFRELKDRIAYEVKEMPNNMDYFPEFMAKRMNCPVGDKDVEIATWEDIKATNQEMPDLKGMDCVGGIDYANTNDFVGCVLLFKYNGKIYIKQKTFVCNKSRDLPGIKAPLKEWEAKGDVEFVNDVEISPELVTGWFEEQEKIYNIIAIAIDKYRYTLLAKALKKLGFDFGREDKQLFTVRPSNIMEIIPVINSWIINHILVVGDVPVFRWMMNNTKKVHTKNNLIYDKIEPHYRKNDTFMAFAAAATKQNLLDDVTSYDYKPLDIITF